MANLIDLITNARARVALPSAAAAGSDDAAINTLITAASRSIMRYCKRSFIVDTYDELLSGRGQPMLTLRNYPIQSIQSVRYRPVTVLKVTNNAANTPQARVSVYSLGVKLTRVTNGVVTTTNVTFAGNATLAALGAAITAADAPGLWSAQSQGYDTWPSVDLYTPNGSTTDYTGAMAGQGALQCVGGPLPNSRCTHMNSKATKSTKGTAACCGRSPTPILSCFTLKTSFGLWALTISGSSTRRVTRQSRKIFKRLAHNLLLTISDWDLGKPPT